MQSKIYTNLLKSRTRLFWYVRLQILFKLSKMFNKKKTSITPSKHHQSSNKLTFDSKLGVRKCHQKHSRKGTKDYQPINMMSLVNNRLNKSAREIINQCILQSINSIIFGYTTPSSIHFKEAAQLSSTKEQLNSYYILSKHRSEYLDGKPMIETSLVKTIQGKNATQFISKPTMHFQTGIYDIMRHHMRKRKRYMKKIATFQTQASDQKYPTPWTKELPTLVSDRDREDSDPYEHSAERKKLNTSQSFELKKLTECIKDMFNKQIFDNPHKKVIAYGGGQNSWLIQGHSIDKKSLIQCDYSSIQGNSKYELQVDSKVKDVWAIDVEENYGLGSLRRKYEEQKILRLKQSSEICEKAALGHRRNPTETPHTKDHFLNEPMTPKESGRSVFVSTQNIIPNSPKKQKSKSKNKEFELNENYLVRFQKKKQPPVVANLKQNNQKDKIKLKSEGSKSKSKQKIKLLTKKK